MGAEQAAKKKEVDLEDDQKEKQDLNVVEDEADNEKDEVVEIPKEELDELKEELERSEAEKQNYIDRLQRLQAEFANYKKRVQKEKERLRSNANKEFISGILPVIDNFDRALATTDSDQDLADFLDGMEMVSRQLFKALGEEGVETIPTVGEEFDPKLHEAVMKESSDEYESGVITAELQRGYLFNDQVLRPAMVKVAE
ncbi:MULTISPECIES: nucleotide exchange factor GrpE [unclassified Candidatus Frackibacter]|uniref:nucleotide exchange factor GrpE n=1 Tax=unclassified Candidatus Frackibacter TaxID=2648818 RepID=UPI00079B13D9|nr:MULTISPECIES: nucleotide exchange factor GrpE [unclassified Candidatus Frackibacter]KXS41661.1 MAG: molecular chaperone GrpE [Candidatus Frackibacter sp. T328-2]SDC73750.1 molecular chaperone GrpE [Candidatus Frackibacter sp. WG11]SEM87850.1 molecular chaperone GrpE [Candidatus Frackibacter sp. WG12]SFL97115.1 molecular chaperone GrpE [Candidatus Frackibacter sp. WG13]